MPRKPPSMFPKPKHPRDNWTSHNAARHADTVNRAIAHDIAVREGRRLTGFPSLKGRANKVRFGSLPPRQRPEAEAELHRLVTSYIIRTGHHPSPQKLASLMGNTTFIIKHARSGNVLRWTLRHNAARKVLNALDRSAQREGTPAAPEATKVPPKKRASWRLTGI